MKMFYERSSEIVLLAEKKEKPDGGAFRSREVYLFLRQENDANINMLTLGHSGSESGDMEDFTSISRELLAALFPPFGCRRGSMTGLRMTMFFPIINAADEKGVFHRRFSSMRSAPACCSHL